MDDPFLSEAQLVLRATVRRFANEKLAPRAAAYDENGQFPRDNFRGLAELGLLGLAIDEEYGGSGGTARQLAVAVEEIARGCAATSVIYIAHLSLCTQFIHMFGNDSQKRRFIPPLARGEKIGAFALTESDSGSDAASLLTRATMAKLFASRVAVESADKAIQIHGGSGYFAPSPVERYYRDAKVTEIYEGTSEVQRLIIARNILKSETG